MIELVVTYLTLLSISTFLSMCEISILTANPIKLEELAKKRNYLTFFLKKKDGCALDLMAINFSVDYLGAMYLSNMISLQFEDNRAYIIAASLITTIMTLQIATLAAKMYASRKSESVLTVFGRLIIAIYYTFKPLAVLLSGPVLVVMRGFLQSNDKSRLGDGELLGVLSMAKREGIIEAKPHRLILRLIDMQNKTVGDIIPKNQSIESVDIESNILDLKEKMLKGAHKRLIVTKSYNDKLFPIGILTFKDIVRVNVAHLNCKLEDKGSCNVPSIASIMHPCVVTPMTAKANTLVNKLDKGDHIVVVTDKDGCMRGVLQSDDIIHSLTSKDEEHTEA